MRLSNNMEIRFRNAVKSDIDSLKELWKTCFDEKTEAVNLFFERAFSQDNAYLATDGEKILAALYLLDGSINGNKAHYLCGASTHPDYRGQGIMGGLIVFSLAKAYEKGDKFSVLYPASESLYGFYSRFGYEEKCFAYTSNLSRKELDKFADESASSNKICNFEEIEKSCFKDNFLNWNNNLIDFAVKYYGIYGVKTVLSENCFAIFGDEEDTADVIYYAYKENKFGELAALLINSTDAENFKFTGKSDKDIFKNSVKEKYGMIKRLDDNTQPPEEIFIGITLA